MSGEIGTQPCEVKFSGKDIAVDFKAVGAYAHTIWRGTEQGPGHFVLRADEGYGEATLHRFDGGGFLEGYWEEEGDANSRDRGMVRISLGETYKPE